MSVGMEKERPVPMWLSVYLRARQEPPWWFCTLGRGTSSAYQSKIHGG